MKHLSLPFFIPLIPITNFLLSISHSPFSTIYSLSPIPIPYAPTSMVKYSASGPNAKAGK